MMKIGFFIKLISLLFCVFIIISLLSNVFAYAQTNNLPSASGVKNVYLYHYESDMVVFQKGSVAEKLLEVRGADKNELIRLIL